MGEVKDTYTHGHDDSVLRSHRWRTAENSAAYLLPHLAPHTRLLDIGCGPGTLTCDLASRVSEVVGIETSDEILAITEKTRAERAADNVRLEVGDVYHLRFGDEEFNVTHAHQVLQHLTDPVAAIGEMVRVTRSGGLVAIRDADYHAMAWYPELGGLDRWMDIYQSVARRNGAEPDAARHLLAWADEAGLDAVDASVGTWLFCTPEDRRWWGDLWAERSRSSTFAEKAIAYGIADERELDEIAQEWRRWSEHPHAWFIVPSGELICHI